MAEKPMTKGVAVYLISILHIIIHTNTVNKVLTVAGVRIETLVANFIYHIKVF